MKFELKHIGYWSLIKISFVVNLIAGFVIGIFVALFIGLMLSFISRMGDLGGMPLLQEDMPPMGIILVMYPFLIGFGGAFFNTFFALIIAFVYNMAAKLLGGVEVELEQMPVMVSQPVAPPQAYVQAHVYHPTPPPPPPPVQPLPPEITPPPDESDSRQQG